MLFKNSRDVEQFATLPIQMYSTSDSFICHVISHCSSWLTRSDGIRTLCGIAFMLGKRRYVTLWYRGRLAKDVMWYSLK